MKKEALLAIVIGILVGLGITFAIYRVRLTLLQNEPEESTLIESNITPSISPSTEKLLITSPLNESIVSSAQATVSGTAEGNEIVVVMVNDEEYITQADEIGAFAVNVTYSAGSNFITVTAISADGSQKTKELIVIFSTALDSNSVATDSASTATNSAQTDN